MGDSLQSGDVMSVQATSLVTAEGFADFVARPQNADRWFELAREEIIELRPPKKSHGMVCGNVARILGNYAITAGSGYVATNDVGYITERDPDSVRAPMSPTGTILRPSPLQILAIQKSLRSLPWKYFRPMTELVA
jgi:hypothetical protein